MKSSEFNKLSKEEKIKVPMKEKPTINKVAVGCGIPAIAFFILVVVLGTCNNGTNNDDNIARIDTSTVQILAISNAKEVVKNTLKSPSSADFPFGEQLCWLMPDSTIVVKGPVDSQNSFGAMIRSTYYIKYKWSGDVENTDNWIIIDYLLE